MVGFMVASSGSSCSVCNDMLAWDILSVPCPSDLVEGQHVLVLVREGAGDVLLKVHVDVERDRTVGGSICRKRALREERHRGVADAGAGDIGECPFEVVHAIQRFGNREGTGVPDAAAEMLTVVSRNFKRRFALVTTRLCQGKREESVGIYRIAVLDDRDAAGESGNLH